MEKDRTFVDELKDNFTYGGMYLKLIYINVGIFLFINLSTVIARLLALDPKLFHNIIADVFTLQVAWPGILLKPWGLITSIFSHFGLFHLIINMLFLFFAGRMYEQFFGKRKLLTIYVVGGIAGGLLELIATFVFPGVSSAFTTIVGASGSIMAIFMALAFYQPQLKVNLFGVVQIRLIFIALFYLISDFINLGSGDGTAHFAHLGGAMLGIFSLKGKTAVFVAKAEKWIYQVLALFSKKKHKLKVDRTGAFESRARRQSDEEYNEQKAAEKREKQERINVILDKIAKSGYESLSKAEKDFLFNQSKNG